MTKEQLDLLSLLSHNLFDTPTANITPNLLNEAKAQAVSTLISSDYMALAQNIRVINAHAEISSLFADIPFTTFKGYASAYYYPHPIYRSMGDVDFIVDPEKYDIAVERLINAGWKKSNTSHERHETFRKGKVIAELHSEIKGIPNGADGISVASVSAEEKVRACLADLTSTARVVETQQGQIIIPDDFHHGLIMLLHVAGHMINDAGIGLRHLCDWAVYVNSVNLELFRSKLEDIGIWIFACQLTAVSTRYLGLTQQSWAGEWDEAFLNALIEDIMNGGNFGKKEAGRHVTLKLKKKSFAEMTAEKYNISCKALLPFFMVVYVIRYGLLMIRGERRFIKPSTIVRANRRNELYKQFRLFEV